MVYGVVYGLYDPRTDELRYIGQTVRPLKVRMYSHLKSSSDTHSARWIRFTVPKSTRAKQIPTEEILRRIQNGASKVKIASELGVSRAFIYLRLRLEATNG